MTLVRRKDLKMKKTNHKHLSLSDRIFIETSLNQNLTFAEIGKAIGKDATTISKEIRKHRIMNEGWIYGDEIPCSHVRTCKKKNACKYKCNVYCKEKTNCRCYKRCKDFIDIRCKHIFKAPYVCNGCSKKPGCRKLKYYYRASNAYDEYKALLSESRVGVNMDKEEFDRLDKLISPLIKQGQPITHICEYLGDEIPFSSRTIYHYFEKGMLTADNMDLPRKVKYKPRKKRREESDNDKSYKLERTYADFQNHITVAFDSEIVEMDTVFGSRSGGNVLLTMLFRRSSIMLIFLMPDCKQSSVTNVFKNLTCILDASEFSTAFPIFLTDNGNEFRHWEQYLPYDQDRNVLSQIFFCDPNSAFQKGRIERNHEYIRYFIPKGKSFSSLDDEKVKRMMNHINSIKRPALNGLSPYEAGLNLLPDKLVAGLGLEPIPAEQINLTHSLLK